MSQSMRIQPIAAVAVLASLALVAAAAIAAKPQSLPAAEKVALFNAIDNGQIEVKLTVEDDQEARVVARNLTDKPLTIEMPEAFAAVPILAQNQGGGGGGDFLNLPPEKFASTKVNFICLEHGKPNPRSDMKYEIKPIETLSTDPRIPKLIAANSQGKVSHAAAQAAAWHLQNEMSWKQLAAKQRKRLGGGSEPYFSRSQLEQAVRLVAHLDKITASGAEAKASEDTTPSSDTTIFESVPEKE